MSDDTSTLKQRLLEAEQRAAYAEALLDSFFTGEQQIAGNLDSALLAQWGRNRFEHKRKKAALLQGEAE